MWSTLWHHLNVSSVSGVGVPNWENNINVFPAKSQALINQISHLCQHKARWGFFLKKRQVFYVSIINDKLKSLYHVTWTYYTTLRSQSNKDWRKICGRWHWTNWFALNWQFTILRGVWLTSYWRKLYLNWTCTPLDKVNHWKFEVSDEHEECPVSVGRNWRP